MNFQSHVYNALGVFVFGYGLGIVGWMAGFGFGFLDVAVGSFFFENPIRHAG